MTPVLRRATPADIPAMAETFLAARRAMLHIVPMVHPDDSVVPWMRDRLFPETRLWVADAGGGRIAALMSLGPGWLHHLYAHPDAQGQGIGTRLLALARRQDEAAAGLDLWTFQANTGARRFYERHGFRPAEFTDGAGNEEKTPDVRYAWRP